MSWNLICVFCVITFGGKVRAAIYFFRTLRLNIFCVRLELSFLLPVFIFQMMALTWNKTFKDKYKLYSQWEYNCQKHLVCFGLHIFRCCYIWIIKLFIPRDSKLFELLIFSLVFAHVFGFYLPLLFKFWPLLVFKINCE